MADEIRAEIEQLGVAQAAPGQAELALQLAQTFDETEAPTARAVVARELSAVMKTLRQLAPVQAEMDPVDELAKRREDGLVRARRA
ncbi:hypothetical protein ACFUJR_32635 [Streptomyces sp. NPDC057271]|uniref:hypothetical protein n=1 Tax=unclassified Streptomyces TaxID=2593676 RepID=UPI00362FCA2B